MDLVHMSRSMAAHPSDRHKQHSKAHKGMRHGMGVRVAMGSPGSAEGDGKDHVELQVLWRWEKNSAE